MVTGLLHDNLLLPEFLEVHALERDPESELP
jgi:hypothetical protein